MLFHIRFFCGAFFPPSFSELRIVIDLSASVLLLKFSKNACTIGRNSQRFFFRLVFYSALLYDLVVFVLGIAFRSVFTVSRHFIVHKEL
jgi:hypothetical protein